MTMGEKILNMRRARGWSQEEMAGQVGVTRQAVSRWESDSAKPDADKIVAICDLFGVSADYLLREQYVGEGSGHVTGIPPSKGDLVKGQNNNLRLWAACAVSVIGGLMMFAMKLIYVIKDTNYIYHSQNNVIYQGFRGFLMIEELAPMWYFSMAAFWGGLIYVLVRLFMCKRKETRDKNGETD